RRIPRPPPDACQDSSGHGESGSTRGRPSRQFVGEHLVEAVVDVDPQSFVSWQDDVIAGVEELGEPLCAGLENSVAGRRVELHHEDLWIAGAGFDAYIAFARFGDQTVGEKIAREYPLDPPRPPSAESGHDRVRVTSVVTERNLNRNRGSAWRQQIKDRR